MRAAATASGEGGGDEDGAQGSGRLQQHGSLHAADHGRFKRALG
jgi:hypothetical protein